MKRALRQLSILLLVVALLSACQGPANPVFSQASGQWDSTAWDAGTWE